MDSEYLKKQWKCLITNPCLNWGRNNGNAASVNLKEINVNGTKCPDTLIRRADIHRELKIIDGGTPHGERHINGEATQYQQNTK